MHPFFSINDCHMGNELSPLAGRVRHNPYPVYREAHRARQSSFAQLRLPAKDLSGPLRPPLVQAHKQVPKPPTTQSPSKSNARLSSAISTFHAPSVSSLLESPLAHTLLNAIHANKSAPLPSSMGIETVSLKAALFKHLPPDSHYGNRRLFLLTDRATSQVSDAYSVFPLLLCEFWEMEEQLPVLAGICDAEGNAIPAPEVGYRVVGMLKKENHAVVVEKQFELDFDASGSAERQVPDAAFGSGFVESEKAGSHKVRYEVVQGLVFQCYQVPSR
ncbi:hypothetical protein HDU98_009052 [Podochytrium sp. JEL0797]|nr:hypothetical protein HDU98_009052 [Podochytrium sp. JEL0797]